MMGRLAGRVALVSGAANGIGRATALRLARDGARLVLLDIEADPLSAVAEEVRSAGSEALALEADCTLDEPVAEAVAQARERFGRIDVLVNNVGQSGRERARLFHESDPEVWRFVVEVSLITTLRLSRLIVAEMRERRSGRIINMSSISAHYGDVGLADYAAAKMGVIGFTRALARELAPFHVTVNVISPGAIRTRAHDRLPKEVIDKVRNTVPMGWVGEPDDVAHAVAFLACDEARYITGQTLLVDGGRWML